VGAISMTSSLSSSQNPSRRKQVLTSRLVMSFHVMPCLSLLVEVIDDVVYGFGLLASTQHNKLMSVRSRSSSCII
jgi:hypothetical protein